MSYQHDIFISYRRHAETLEWINDHLRPLLDLHVEFELGRKPAIYVDTQIESGTSWPASLGAALGASRVLIALWSGNYFASVWCTEEFTHMLSREQETGLRTVPKPHGVVIPAFIHDGDKFPKALRHIQHIEIQRCFNVRMSPKSPRAEELAAILSAQAPAIAACIKHAPTWRKAWAKKAAAKLFKQFHRVAAVQAVVPTFTSP